VQRQRVVFGKRIVQDESCTTIKTKHEEERQNGRITEVMISDENNKH